MGAAEMMMGILFMAGSGKNSKARNAPWAELAGRKAAGVLWATGTQGAVPCSALPKKPRGETPKWRTFWFLPCGTSGRLARADDGGGGDGGDHGAPSGARRGLPCPRASGWGAPGPLMRMLRLLRRATVCWRADSDDLRSCLATDGRRLRSGWVRVRGAAC